MDTLSAARDLEKAGFDRKQAEAVASTVNELASGNFATKADLYIGRYSPSSSPMRRSRSAFSKMFLE